MSSSVCKDVNIKTAIQVCFDDVSNCVNGTTFFLKTFAVTHSTEVTKTKIETTTPTTDKSTVSSTNQMTSTNITQKLRKFIRFT